MQTMRAAHITERKILEPVLSTSPHRPPSPAWPIAAISLTRWPWPWHASSATTPHRSAHDDLDWFKKVNDRHGTPPAMRCCATSPRS